MAWLAFLPRPSFYCFHHVSANSWAKLAFCGLEEVLAISHNMVSTGKCVLCWSKTYAKLPFLQRFPNLGPLLAGTPLVCLRSRKERVWWGWGRQGGVTALLSTFNQSCLLFVLIIYVLGFTIWFLLNTESCSWAKNIENYSYESQY